MNVRTTTSTNGLRIVSADIAHVASCSVGVWVGVGGRHEPAALTGVSHFIEHMMFKGTPTRNPAQISQAIEGRGGYFNAFTQEENTCYYGKILAEYRSELVDVLLDMYKSARFPSEELAKERGVIVEEIMMYLDQPSQLVQDLLQQAVWYRHPLGHPLLGTPQIIQGMTRSDMMKFKSAAYHPGNTVVVAAGRVRHEDVVEEVESRLGRMKLRPPLRKPRVTARTPQSRYRHFDKVYEQTHLCIGFRIFGNRDPRRFAMKILSVVLGENMSSRLFQLIREQHGLAYSVHSGAQLFEDSGCLNISAGVDRTEVMKCLDLIFRELRKLRRRPVPARELKRARDYAVGQLMMGLETSTSLMMWCGESMMNYGSVHDPEEVRRSLSAVTAEDLQALAHEFLNNSRVSLAVVGGHEGEITEDRIAAWLE